MKNREELIAALDEARRRLDSVLERVPADMEVYPSWKLKQVLDHIAGWDDAVLASIRAHARGELPVVTAPRGIDYYNQQTVSTRESLPLHHSRREYEVTREMLKQAIREIPEEKYTQPFVSPWGDMENVEQLVAIFIHHETVHAAEIQAILEQAGRGG